VTNIDTAAWRFSCFLEKPSDSRVNIKHAGQNMRDRPITHPSSQVAVIRVPFPMDEADYTAPLAAFKPALTSKRKPEREDESEDAEDDS
jgi:hypothetical protein